MPYSNNNKDAVHNRFSMNTETEPMQDVDLSDVFHLRKKIKILEKQQADKEEQNGKLEKKCVNIEQLFNTQVETNRELRKEKNFWKKACKEAMEKLESATTKIENIQQTSDDLINKNKNLRIRFQNYEIEVERLKNRIRMLEENHL